MRVCEVPGCVQVHSARGMCNVHYKRWRRGAPLDGAVVREPASGICTCEQPHIDEIGMCTKCGRLVVTFAHGNANRVAYRKLYPVEWARAVDLGLRP